MNYPIKTNQLIVEYDYSKINDEYDIYKITNDKFFTRNAHIFDSPLIEKGVMLQKSLKINMMSKQILEKEFLKITIIFALFIIGIIIMVQTILMILNIKIRQFSI